MSDLKTETEQAAGREASTVERIVMHDHQYKQQLLNLINIGIYRVVRNSKRKRKLSRRGEHIWWCKELNCWLWNMNSDDYDLAA